MPRPLVGGISKNPETSPSYFFKVIACTDFQGPTLSRAGDIEVFQIKLH